MLTTGSEIWFLCFHDNFVIHWFIQNNTYAMIAFERPPPQVWSDEDAKWIAGSQLKEPLASGPQAILERRLSPLSNLFPAIMLGCLARARVQCASMETQKWAFLILPPQSGQLVGEVGGFKQVGAAGQGDGSCTSTSDGEFFFSESTSNGEIFFSESTSDGEFFLRIYFGWINSYKASSSFLESSTTSPLTVGSNSRRPKHNHSTLSTSMGINKNYLLVFSSASYVI